LRDGLKPQLFQGDRLMKRGYVWIGLIVSACIVLGGEARAEEFVEFCGQKIELTATELTLEKISAEQHL
jgi:hypothetical protein